tara:strand:+ start:457 stop:2670 length:2214 start_codon:yes stop_codon:yes gene_type:complete
MPDFVEIIFPQVTGMVDASDEDNPVFGSMNNAVFSISPDVEELLVDNGYDAEELNKITWPIGADTFAVGKFLISKTTLQFLSSVHATQPTAGLRDRLLAGRSEEAGPSDDPPTIDPIRQSTPIELRFNGLLFDRMYMRAPIPLLPSKSGNLPDFYVIELVDERYWWHTHTIKDQYTLNSEPKDGMFKHGLNMIDMNSRDVYLKQSMFRPDSIESGIPWTLPDIMRVMLNYENEYPDFNGLEEFPFLSETDWYFEQNSFDQYSDFDIVDLHATGRPFGEFLDAVFTSSGFVLVAYPSNETAPGNQRYRVMPIEDRYNANQRMNLTIRAMAIAGGLLPSFSPYAEQQGEDESGQLLAAPIGSVADESSNEFVPTDSLISEIPSSIYVYFPKAAEATLSNDEGVLDYNTDRWASIESIAGRPSLYSGERSFSIYGSLHSLHTVAYVDENNPESGVFTTWKDKEDFVEYADRHAKTYYSRFRSSPINVLLRGTFGSPDYGNAMFLWAGSQEVIWSLTEQGPTTKITGEYHHPLFGFSKNQTLDQGNIRSVGNSRIRPSATGGVIVESASASLTSLHQAIVLGYDTNQPTYNAKYVAVSTVDASLKISVPIVPIRPHSTASVNCQPLEIGDPCIIGVVPASLVDENPFTNTHDVVEAGVGVARTGSLNGVLTGDGLFTRSMLNGVVEQGTTFEYFKLEDGRICVLYVFEIPSTVQCELITSGLTERSANQETFYSNSNLFGY